MARFDYTYYSLSVNNLDAETSDAKAHEPNTVFNEQRDNAIIENCKIMILVSKILKLI